jgi:hypothetical protein
MFFLCPSLAYSYPMDDIYKNLDITSFNSSLKPKIAHNERVFSDFKDFPSPVISDDKITINNDDWIYELKVVREVGKDHKNYHVCFIDKAKHGTYNAQSPMLIRKYSDYYVAINVRSNACEKFAK